MRTLQYKKQNTPRYELSFSNFTQITEVPEDFEFSNIEDEFEETEKKIKKDHIVY